MAVHGDGDVRHPEPAAWAGLNPLIAHTERLAAYVLNHAYITAALS